MPKAGYVDPRRWILIVPGAFALTLYFIATDYARAQSAPDTENGRYTLSPVGGDFLRLDNRTGVVSTCSNDGGWVCRLVPDERAALDSEVGKLQAENKKLKEQLTQRDSAAARKPDAPSKDEQKNADGTGTFELQLPADHQKLMALIDRVWDRLIEMANRVQKKLSEKI